MQLVPNKKILFELATILCLFWLITTSLVWLKYYSLAIISFAALTYFIALTKPYLLISLFVYFLPLSSLIGTERNLIEVIGFDEITQIGIIFFMLIHRVKAPGLRGR